MSTHSGKSDLINRTHNLSTCLKSIRPQPSEQEPLIKSLLTKKGITDRRVNQLIKSVVHQAAKFYDQLDEKKAQRLRKFSAHWLRHLSVTMQGKAGIAKHHIKDNAGHEKWQTTEGYFHSLDYERHHDMEKHDCMFLTNNEEFKA